MAHALFELDGIRHQYASKLALHVPALTLRPGRMYTLAGHNGSGKTTLLHVLAFLLRPTSGDLRFEGERVGWARDALLRVRRQVTLVHQSPYLFAGSVEQNLAVGLRHSRLPAEEARERVARALAAVDLAGSEGRDARALSQGEVQRVAVARALLLQPRVVLLDEPLANVDVRSARILEALLAALPARGHTVVLSSHDPELPRRFGSEVITLHDGALVSPAGRDDEAEALLWSGAVAQGSPG